MSTPPEVTTLELYKLTVEMADRVSARRATANTFFLTTQTALTTILGIAVPSAKQASWLITLLLALAGSAISVAWWLQLRAYRALNAAKFEVIVAIEDSLTVKPFATEWQILQQPKSASRSNRYIELGAAERIIPLVFPAIYVLMFLGSL